MWKYISIPLIAILISLLISFASDAERYRQLRKEDMVINSIESTKEFDRTFDLHFKNKENKQK